MWRNSKSTTTGSSKTMLRRRSTRCGKSPVQRPLPRSRSWALDAGRSERNARLAPQQQQPQLPLAEIILAGFEGDLFSSSSNGMTEYFTNLMLYIHDYYLFAVAKQVGRRRRVGRCTSKRSALRKSARCLRSSKHSTPAAVSIAFFRRNGNRTLRQIGRGCTREASLSKVVQFVNEKNNQNQIYYVNI